MTLKWNKSFIQHLHSTKIKQINKKQLKNLDIFKKLSLMMMNQTLLRMIPMEDLENMLGFICKKDPEN